MFLLYKAECHFSFVVFCHSFHFPSDITTVFSKVRKHSILVFCKKVPNAAVYTWRSSHPDMKFLPEREWMTEKKKKRHFRNNTDSFHEAVLESGKGFVSDFPFFFFLYLPSFLINATPFTSTRKHRQPRHHSCPCPPQKNSAVRRTVWLWKAFPEILNWDGPQAVTVVKTSVGCFVGKMAQKLASLSNFTESVGGAS